jgi:hypothetical protein
MEEEGFSLFFVRGRSMSHKMSAMNNQVEKKHSIRSSRPVVHRRRIRLHRLVEKLCCSTYPLTKPKTNNNNNNNNTNNKSQPKANLVHVKSVKNDSTFLPSATPAATQTQEHQQLEVSTVMVLFPGTLTTTTTTTMMMTTVMFFPSCRC